MTNLFVRFSSYSFNEVKEMSSNVDNKSNLYPIITKIAKYCGENIKNRELTLRPIHYFVRIDGMNKKERIIGVEEPLHQIFDYIAVEGMRELFNAKIGVFQCASLPSKGQSYGQKYIQKWVKEKDTIYFIKGDIKKCFPSIPHDKLKQLLKRDVKNDTILWLVFELIDMFGQAYTIKIGNEIRFVPATNKGISIGSYLSQYLSNYYLSYAYHYACSENMFKIRKTKRSGDVKVRLINHVLFYMDDFLLTGSNKKYLKMAMKKLIKFMYEFLELDVKPNWKICKISSSEPIDMMGFVFRKVKTVIRTKIFLKTRRYFLKAKKLLKRGLPIPERLAYQCISGYGWYKNTDSHKIRQKLGIDEVHNICKKVISENTKLRKIRRGEVNAIVI